MEREISPDALDGVLDEVSYPALRPDVAAEMREVTVVYADEERNLGALISDCGPDTFEEPADLRAAIEDRLPEIPQR